MASQRACGLARGEAGKLEETPPSQALALALSHASRRSLTENSGSFGGLTVPANVALGPDGSIYLLDDRTMTLKRFDPCECRFQTVPCFGGAARGRDSYASRMASASAPAISLSAIPAIIA